MSFWDSAFDNATGLYCEHFGVGPDACDSDRCYEAMRERAAEMLDKVWPFAKAEIVALRASVSVWADQATKNAERFIRAEAALEAAAQGPTREAVRDAFRHAMFESGEVLDIEVRFLERLFGPEAKP